MPRIVRGRRRPRRRASAASPTSWKLLIGHDTARNGSSTHLPCRRRARRRAAPRPRARRPPCIHASKRLGPQLSRRSKAPMALPMFDHGEVHRLLIGRGAGRRIRRRRRRHRDTFRRTSTGAPRRLGLATSPGGRELRKAPGRRRRPASPRTPPRSPAGTSARSAPPRRGVSEFISTGDSMRPERLIVEGVAPTVPRRAAGPARHRAARALFAGPIRRRARFAFPSIEYRRIPQWARGSPSSRLSRSLPRA